MVKFGCDVAQPPSYPSSSLNAVPETPGRNQIAGHMPWLVSGIFAFTWTYHEELVGRANFPSVVITPEIQGKVPDHWLVFFCAVSDRALFTVTCDGPNIAMLLLPGVFGPEYGDGSRPMSSHRLPWAPR